ncbi:MAG: HK97 gp10 family phage protein [Anaerorhabdus sp.]
MTLRKIGESGVIALRAGTPIGATGQTARGWKYKITSNKRGAELAFYNTAHPQASANVAKLIQFGHGTKTGGYVPPRDYINPALRNIFNRAADDIAKEVFR